MASTPRSSSTSSRLRPRRGRYIETDRFRHLVLASFLLLQHSTGAGAQNSSGSTNGNNVNIVVVNNCGETIWPGIGTQFGLGPGTGGFELTPGNSSSLWVSWDWQGRVWARTNCSFNANGTGPSQANGVNGNGAACLTGDCMGVLNCEYTGAPPATLFETNCAAANKSYYDISLVDGYNVPVGVQLITTSENCTDIPPNLTNPACIATAGWLWDSASTGTIYSNSTYPIPWETSETNQDLLAGWCPWDLQQNPPSRPGDGVYPYPDSNIQRPIFDACLSACAATNSPSDCCTGSYDSAGACQPSDYSKAAKAVCPDAYSYAFDDQTSTFTIPAGCGGWIVTWCPEGRSTNIIQTLGPQMQALASTGHATAEILADASNITFIEEHNVGARATRPASLPWIFLVAVGAAFVGWCLP